MKIHVVLLFVADKVLVTAFSDKEIAEKYSKTLGAVKFQIKEVIVDNILNDMTL